MGGDSRIGAHKERKVWPSWYASKSRYNTLEGYVGRTIDGESNGRCI